MMWLAGGVVAIVISFGVLWAIMCSAGQAAKAAEQAESLRGVLDEVEESKKVRQDVDRADHDRLEWLRRRWIR